ncbi:hypothetical protein LmNIHS28_00829 [Listeria monocytogenes]|nr:hypothetical protein LmNIHS28_00829 [Listeria monocytogenes]
MLAHSRPAFFKYTSFYGTVFMSIWVINIKIVFIEPGNYHTVHRIRDFLFTFFCLDGLPVFGCMVVGGSDNPYWCACAEYSNDVLNAIPANIVDVCFINVFSSQISYGSMIHA